MEMMLLTLSGLLILLIFPRLSRVSNTAIMDVTDVWVWDPCVENVSDHLPISVKITLSDNLVISPGTTQKHSNRLHWAKLSDADIQQRYTDPLSLVLEDICSRHSLVENDYSMESDKLEKVLSEVVQSMTNVANKGIPKSRPRKHLKPFWSPTLTQLEKAKFGAKKIWDQAGRPRDANAETYKNYKEAKRAYRCAYRKAEHEYNLKCQQDIKETEMMDQRYFWYLVRRARKQPLSNMQNGIVNESGTVVTESSDLLDAWVEHFVTLSKPQEGCDFDDDFKHYVENVVSEIDGGSVAWHESLFDIPFTIPETQKVCNSMKCGKAGGWDGITPEHIKFGGRRLVEIFTYLFNVLVSSKHVPQHFRRGVRIPLFKGGDKDPQFHDNYRGITLLSVISKFYESLLLGRSMDWMRGVIDEHQGGAQKHCSSMHSTFLLREVIAHLNDDGNSAYVVLLDARKAFACVWIDGLFYQLYKIGMDYRLWSILRSYYLDCQCCVQISGAFSDWFSVSQGGVLSAWLYQLFINSLLEDLKVNGMALKIQGITCHYICQADDIALVHMFQGCIQTNLNIVYQHSKKWRYTHNSSKCKVIVFDAGGRNPLNSRGVNVGHGNSHIQTGGDVNGMSNIKLGGVALECVEGEKHMGVILGKDPAFLDKRIMKGRRSAIAMQSLACSGTLLNPVIASKLYWSISISSMLYGVEVWGLKDCEIVKLERAHTQMARNIQGLPGFVANVSVLALLGWISIQGYIDRRCLLFLWSILRLDVFCIYKQLCMYRLLRIRGDSTVSNGGPVLNFYKTCEKYGLCDVVFDMIDSGIVMSKGQWKRLISRKVMEYECMRWRVEIQMYSSLTFYKNVISKYGLCIWWRLAEHNPETLKSCRSVINVLTGGCVWFHKTSKDMSGNRCILCEYNIRDSVYHFLCDCQALTYERLAVLNAPECINMCEDYVTRTIEEKWMIVMSDNHMDTFDMWVPVGTVVANGIHKMLTVKRQLIIHM